MKKKAQIQIGIAVIILILFSLLVFYIIPTLQRQVVFGIELKEGKILEDSSTILFYSITNNLDERIENAQVDFQILGQTGTYKIRSIGIIEKNNIENGAFDVSSYSLRPGFYTIQSNLSYYVPSKQEKINSLLTLQLEVITKP